MKLNYRQRLFLYFSIVFTVFTIGIVIVDRAREKSYRAQMIEEKLNVYTDVINDKLATSDGSLINKTSTLEQILPDDLRLTLIDGQGNVRFDNIVADFSSMENHLNRLEIQQAKNAGSGSEIRASETNLQEYLYYAKQFDGDFIRVALPYNLQLQHFLKADNAFLYFILAFFTAFLLIIHLVTFRFGKSIKQLRDFVLQPDKLELQYIKFPSDELGEIGAKITENYFNLKESKSALYVEKQKLLQHIQISEEGICFFSSNSEVEFYNGLFMQYLNSLVTEPTSDASMIVINKLFKELQDFIAEKETHYFETNVSKHGKTFSIRANRFDDNSFEVILSDITKQEKMNKLKQEMTGNIAHELRTPITGIRGYLETILRQTSLTTEQRVHFTQQAFNQTIVLSEIIADMSLIAKIEENSSSFALADVNLSELLQKVKDDVSESLKLKSCTFTSEVPANITLKGNANLLYSLFINLTNNALRYAGENIDIHISLYNEDADFYYFSLYDTGVGIPDERHLNRLFERFYRVNEGRTRETGGSGLGLSIVRNAVAFHKGKITVKNRRSGGLEFLFQLHK